MRVIVLGLAAIVVTGCNRSPSVEMHNVTGNQVAAGIAAAGGTAGFLRPGKWQTSVTIDSMDVPGLPPEVAARTRTTTTQSRTVESCLTPEQAAKPAPAMFGGDSDRCRYQDFTMSGGKIAVTMRCAAPAPNGNVTQDMKMNGTYGPDKYQMTMASTTDTGSGAAGRMSMKMHLDAKRLGDCDAQKANG